METRIGTIDGRGQFYCEGCYVADPRDTDPREVTWTRGDHAAAYSPQLRFVDECRSCGRCPRACALGARIVQRGNVVITSWQIGQALRKIDADRLYVVTVTITSDVETRELALVDAPSAGAAALVARDAVASRYCGDQPTVAAAAILAQPLR